MPAAALKLSISAAAVVLLAAVALIFIPRADRPAAGAAPPPAAPAPPTTQSASSDSGLVGSASCRACHARFYELWATSHHGLALQAYTDAFAANHLTAPEADLRVGQQSYRAAIGPGAGWVLETSAAGRRRLPIVHVLGGKNVYYFLTPADRGRWQTLPVAYDVRAREWFDTSGSATRHFPGGPPDAPLHWTDRAYTFNPSCHSCHVSQLSTNYDPDQDAYNTTWREPGINCESCHGPAAPHVAACRAAGADQAPADLRITTITRSRGYPAEAVDAACAGCHAKMVPLTAHYQPGEPYFDHYNLVTLEDRDFYPDARDLGENYTYTLWRLNPCAQSGQLDCLHCHTSSGRFRFNDNPNQACLPCHAARVAEPTPHTHHAADGDGSVCIRCHMALTEFARMRRSDHSFLPPTPAATLAFGSPNACNLCHADRDATWADAAVRSWHTRDYQQPILQRAALIESARRRDWSHLPETLQYIADPAREEIYATSLLRLLIPCDRPEKWPVVLAALDDPSPLVRAAAAQALENHLTPAALPALLRAARDPLRLVRVHAAVTLAAVPLDSISARDRQALSQAIDEFLAATLVRPDQPAGHYNRGNFHLSRGEYEAALDAFTQALQLQPDDVPTRANMSLACNALGRNADAERLLRAALQLAPGDVAVHVNLGMLLGELGRLAESEAAFRTALELDQRSATAAYNLAVILAPDRPAESLEFCRRAQALEPLNPKYAYTLAYYLHAAGQPQEAVSVLEQLLGAGAADANAYALLGRLYQETGQPERAAALWRHAAQDTSLPVDARRYFEHLPAAQP